MKISALEEGNEFQCLAIKEIISDLNKHRHIRNETERIRKKCKLKISALGEYGEGHKFAPGLANIQPK